MSTFLVALLVLYALNAAASYFFIKRLWAKLPPPVVALLSAKHSPIGLALTRPWFFAGCLVAGMAQVLLDK